MWALAAAAVLAQDPETPVEPKTGFALPPKLGELKRVDWKTFDDARLGTYANYHLAGGMTVTLYIYDLGQDAIPDGGSSKLVQREVDSVRIQMEILRRKGDYHSVKDLGQKKTRVDGIEFLSGEYEVTLEEGGVPHLSRVYVTGARNHFVKLRCTCLESDRERCEKGIDEALKRVAGMIRGPEEY
jgi:hypothetical protein